jgi:hypothetical protein
MGRMTSHIMENNKYSIWNHQPVDIYVWNCVDMLNPLSWEGNHIADVAKTDCEWLW